MKRKREEFKIPTEVKAYKCHDCGCIFEARLLRGKQNKTSTPHLETWMGPVNNCCHCGGTMLRGWNSLTKKELKILSEMLERRRAKQRDEQFNALAESQGKLLARLDALDAGLHETAMRNHQQIMAALKEILESLLGADGKIGMKEEQGVLLADVSNGIDDLRKKIMNQFSCLATQITGVYVRPRKKARSAVGKARACK